MKWNIFLMLMGFGAILAAAIQIALFTSGHYSISSDESARTLTAYRWYETKAIPEEVWLPLHSIILGYSFEISKNMIAVPRAVSLFFGILSIAALSLLTHNLFKDRIITLTAVMLYIFLPERIILTAVPLPEIIFIFFILSGSAFLVMWIEKKKDFNLFIASLFWMTAGALRYEGWIFSASLFFFCCYELQRKNLPLKSFFGAGLILCSFPLFWLLMNQIQHGNPFAFLSATAGMFQSKHGNSMIKTAYLNVFWQFIEQNYNSYNIIGVAGAFFVISRERAFKWIILCFSGLILLGIISAFGKALPSHNFWRTSAVWTILLIPFTSFILHEVSKYFSLKKPFRINISFCILILLIIQFSIVTLSKINKMNSPYCLTKQDVTAGESLSKIIFKSRETSAQPGATGILIEKNRLFNHLNISVSLKYPGNITYFDKPGSKLPRCRQELVTKRINIGEVKKLNIGYLLFRSLKAKNYLSSQKNVKALRKFDDWILYKII